MSRWDDPEDADAADAMDDVRRSEATAVDDDDCPGYLIHRGGRSRDSGETDQEAHTRHERSVRLFRPYA